MKKQNEGMRTKCQKNIMSVKKNIFEILLLVLVKMVNMQEL